MLIRQQVWNRNRQKQNSRQVFARHKEEQIFAEDEASRVWLIHGAVPTA